MLPWFLDDCTRLRHERAELEKLREGSSWLTALVWECQDGIMVVDATITINGHDYTVRLTYPRLFPSVPVVVTTPEATFRWTLHQYGGNHGSLCLEYGPDNWMSSVTGAMMLESAFRLLDAERPLEGAARPSGEVPSRHALTEGQQARSRDFRVVVTDTFFGRLSSLQGYSSMECSFGGDGNVMVTFIHGLGDGDARWNDPTVPAKFHERPSPRETGACAAVASLRPFLNCRSVDELNAAGVGQGLPAGLFAVDGTSPIPGVTTGLALIHSVAENETMAFYRFKSGSAIQLHLVRGGPSGGRMPPERSLAGKRVAVIGLGSAGSKLAICLARSEADRFVLVDHDIFLPGNIVRNALDWSAVGSHKAESVAEVIKRIVLNPDIEVRSHHLTGQESNRTIAATVDRISQCDVIVDATADGGVFNLLAGIAVRAKKPLVWLEIFGGGIGGLVARSRPVLDPSPQAMRALYLQYCDQHPYQGLRAENRYDVREDGRVLTATDADVSILAHHAARLLEDTVLAPSSGYPYSMYLVGLTKAWIFTGPFATIPLDTTGLQEPEPSNTESTFTPEDIEFLVSLMPKKNPDEATPSA